MTVVGIHTPETEQEYEIDRVRRAVEKYEFTFPVLIDNAWSNWKAWSNRYWPTIYLIDRAGYVRYRWQGELNYKESGGYQEVQQRIEELLRETL